MRILEEFWYGNIEPTEYDTSSKEYKKLLEPICRNEEKLKATMTYEQKELFKNYTDCVREYQTITDCILSKSSFRLGGRMMIEVMEKAKFLLLNQNFHGNLFTNEELAVIAFHRQVFLFLSIYNKRLMFTQPENSL